MSKTDDSSAADRGSELTDRLGQLPEAGMTEANPYLDLGSLDPHRGAQILTWYSADQMRAYAAQERAAERERWQKWTCRKEWETVNDPPCHPGDKNWRPCANCVGPNAAVTGLRQETPR